MQKSAMPAPNTGHPSEGKLLVAVTNMINYDLFDGMQSSAADLGYGLVFAHILTGREL